MISSFLRHPDEDFTNWRVLETATHPELIAAMWPRPVLVEWADGDDTTTPVWHDRAWAEVRDWASRWAATDRVERAAFRGIHEIGGGASFEFLDRWLRPERSSGRDYTYTLQGRGRDLDGISDHLPDTLPYLTRVLDSRSPLRETICVGLDDTAVRGIAMRLSRIGDPGALSVRMGRRRARQTSEQAGSMAIGCTRSGTSVRGGYRRASPRAQGGTRLPTDDQAERGTAPANAFIAYGPRPLGGSPAPDAFAIAYRVLGVGEPPEEEPTHEFGRRLLDAPRLPRLVSTRTPAPVDSRDAAIDGSWRIESRGPSSAVVETAIATLRDGLSQLFALDLATADRRPARSGDPAPAGAPGRRRPPRTAPTRRSQCAWTPPASTSWPLLRVASCGASCACSTTYAIAALPSPRPASTDSRPSSPGASPRPRCPPASGTRRSPSRWSTPTACCGGSQQMASMGSGSGSTSRRSRTTRRSSPSSTNHSARCAWAACRRRPSELLHTGSMCMSTSRRRTTIRCPSGSTVGIPMCGATGSSAIRCARPIRACAATTPRSCADSSARRRPSAAWSSTSTSRATTTAATTSASAGDAQGAGAGARRRSHTRPSRTSTMRSAPMTPARSRSSGATATAMTGSSASCPTLPGDIALQIDMSKGLAIERDGIRHVTGDYNLTLIGPPPHFERLRAGGRSIRSSVRRSRRSTR